MRQRNKNHKANTTQGGSPLMPSMHIDICMHVYKHAYIYACIYTHRPTHIHTYSHKYRVPLGTLITLDEGDARRGEKREGVTEPFQGTLLFKNRIPFQQTTRGARRRAKEPTRGRFQIYLKSPQSSPKHPGAVARLPGAMESHGATRPVHLGGEPIPPILALACSAFDDCP